MPQNRLKRQRGLSYSVLPRDTHSVVAFLRSSYYLITHDVQIEGFCKILDNIDLLAVLATGLGKTAFVSMFILIVLAIKKNSSLCLTVKFPDNPCMLFICPTKYLEHQMVPGAFKLAVRKRLLRQSLMTVGYYGEVWTPRISNQFRYH